MSVADLLVKDSKEAWKDVCVTGLQLNKSPSVGMVMTDQDGKGNAGWSPLPATTENVVWATDDGLTQTYAIPSGGATTLPLTVKRFDSSGLWTLSGNELKGGAAGNYKFIATSCFQNAGASTNYAALQVYYNGSPVASSSVQTASGAGAPIIPMTVQGIITDYNPENSILVSAFANTVAYQTVNNSGRDYAASIRLEKI